MNKYRAKPVRENGEFFASQKEWKRWGELKLLLRAGRIHDLQRQVRFPLAINGIKLGAYIADFVYIEDTLKVVEDVKSTFTATLPLYRLKKKLVAALHGVEIKEV